MYVMEKEIGRTNKNELDSKTKQRQCFNFLERDDLAIDRSEGRKRSAANVNAIIDFFSCLSSIQSHFIQSVAVL